jgi:thiamine-monophosphate kinase
LPGQKNKGQRIDNRGRASRDRSVPKSPPVGSGTYRLRFPSPHTKLSRIGELSLLDRIRKDFPQKAGNIAVGIGDDAAVIKPSNKYLLVTTDMMVEGVHFDLRFMTPFQLGFKLISVNVSDIFAMGGKPFYCLLNVAVSGNMRREFVDMLFDGVKEAMSLYRTVLAGGDLSAADRISLSATVIGYTGKYITRSGAKTGDRIYVTGTLGDSAGGLEVLKRVRNKIYLQKTGEGKEQRAKSKDTALAKLSRLGLKYETVEPLLRRHLMPEARDPSRFVKCATSMIDVSDGLLIDLTRLCNESKVGARIYAENVPLTPELKSVASILGISALELALSGGEDYELLFTAPPGKRVDAVYIGDITESGRVIVDGKGKEKPFAAKGYQHFVIAQ